MDIIINADGRQYKTTKSTLSKLSYFEKMFSLVQSSNNEFTVDIDHHVMEHLLNLLRDDLYYYVPKYINYYLDKNNMDFYNHTCEFIKINVGGIMITTKKETLIKCKYFEKLFSEKFVNDQEIIFINRDGDNFWHILSYLRNPMYEIPKELKHEIDFYGVKMMEDNESEQNIMRAIINNNEIPLFMKLLEYINGKFEEITFRFNENSMEILEENEENKNVLYLSLKSNIFKNYKLQFEPRNGVKQKTCSINLECFINNLEGEKIIDMYMKKEDEKHLYVGNDWKFKTFGSAKLFPEGSKYMIDFSKYAKSFITTYSDFCKIWRCLNLKNNSNGSVEFCAGVDDLKLYSENVNVFSEYVGTKNIKVKCNSYCDVDNHSLYYDVKNEYLIGLDKFSGIESVIFELGYFLKLIFTFSNNYGKFITIVPTK
jgi:hypothetical protein